MQSTGDSGYRTPLRRVVSFFSFLVGLTLLAGSPHLSRAEEAKRSFNIPATDAVKALKQFSEQSGQGLIVSSESVRGVRTNPVKGDLTAAEALAQLLDGTGLVAKRDAGTGAYAVHRENGESKNGPRAAQNGDRPGNPSKAEDGTMQLPAFEVMGNRVLNLDLRRDRDGSQPYVIFDRVALTRSGATNLQDFFKQRLTMNTVGQTNDQGGVSSVSGFDARDGGASTINLRGLGANHTLVLVDGRRIGASWQALSGFRQQGNINGIPLAAVERVEILPATASGIYGGSATGGVVNIVLRRDYAGGEVQFTYDNTFDTDSAQRRIDVSAGFHLNRGKTNVLLAASYSDRNSLLSQDREFFFRGIQRRYDLNLIRYLPPATPPFSALPNLRSTDGTNLRLDNGTVLPASFTSVPAGYAGTVSDGGAALVANAGRYNLEPPYAANVSIGRYEAFTATPENKSLMATVRHEFRPGLQLYLEASAVRLNSFLPTSNNTTFTLSGNSPRNPFQQPVLVNVTSRSIDSFYSSSTGDLRVTWGVLVELPAGWKAGLDYVGQRIVKDSVSPLRFSVSGLAEINAGAVDVLRDPQAFPFDFRSYLVPSLVQSPARSTLHSGSLLASGPVGFSLPGGEPVISARAEYRDEQLGETGFTASDTTVSLQSSFVPRRSQQIQGLYLETRLPIFSKRNRLPLLEELELQLAVRRDEYKVNGVTGSVVVNPNAAPVLSRAVNRTASSDPTIALKWKPITDLTVRASYGTGFVPPTVSQILPLPSFTATNGLVDPRRGGTVFSLRPGSVTTGGNSNLSPEQSTSRSAGVVFAPSALPGWRASLDYTRIDLVDRISTFPGGNQGILNNEAIVAQRIGRGTASADDTARGWAGPVTSINASLFNIAEAEVEAFDAQVDGRINAGALGSFSLFGMATWQTHYRTRILATQPMVENVGFSSGSPVRFKANFGATWERGNWTVGWTGRYFDEYLVYPPNPLPALLAVYLPHQGNNGWVKAQFYHDLFVQYRFGRRLQRLASFLGDVEVQAGVRNVFNRVPSYDAAGGQGFYSYFGDPRLATYSLSVKVPFAR